MLAGSAPASSKLLRAVCGQSCGFCSCSGICWGELRALYEPQSAMQSQWASVSTTLAQVSAAVCNGLFATRMDAGTRKFPHACLLLVCIIC